MLELSAETAAPASAGWRSRSSPPSATDGTGVAELWDAITAHRDHIAASGVLERRRRFRLGEELREIVARRLEQRARELCTGERWDELTDDVLARDVDPWTAADEMLAPVLSLSSGPIAAGSADGSSSATRAGTSAR